ncbi:MAG: Gfo/Idh/MocA family oxidoreductase [Phycisphaerales bacterium]
MNKASSNGAGSGRTLRCGAVGVGRMGRHHARVYAEMDGVELVGVVDADEKTARAIAEKHNTRAFANERELLAAGVDAVSIASPTTAHRKCAEPFLEAGVACLIEKPLAQTAQESEALMAMAEKSGACLMVGHIERFNPVMRAMRKAAASDDDPEGRQIGRKLIPRFIEVHRVSPMTFRSVDIGVVMDMMIHDLDVVLMLMGGREPDEVQAAGVAIVTEHEDLCNARLTFKMPEGTCVANITASRLAMKTERVARITGENGYIKIDYAAKQGLIIKRTANELQMRQVREELRAGKDLTDLNWQDLVNLEPLVIDNAEPIVMEIEEFLDAVRSGRRPEIDASAGMANVRTAERIVAAIREFMGDSEGSPQAKIHVGAGLRTPAPTR